MRIPRVRFTIRSILVAVTFAALVSRVCHEYPDAGHRATILLACVVAGAYGLWAMRHPFFWLPWLLLLWGLAPAVGRLDFDIITFLARGCSLGWVIGDPAVWIARCSTKAGKPVSTPDTPGTSP